MYILATVSHWVNPDGKGPKVVQSPEISVRREETSRETECIWNNVCPSLKFVASSL